MNSRDEMPCKYMWDPYCKNEDELRVILKYELENSQNWTDVFYFSVFEKFSGEIIGMAFAFIIEKIIIYGE